MPAGVSDGASAINVIVTLACIQVSGYLILNHLVILDFYFLL